MFTRFLLCAENSHADFWHYLTGWLIKKYWSQMQANFLFPRLLNWSSSFSGQSSVPGTAKRGIAAPPFRVITVCSQQPRYVSYLYSWPEIDCIQRAGRNTDFQWTGWQEASLGVLGEFRMFRSAGTLGVEAQNHLRAIVSNCGLIPESWDFRYLLKANNGLAGVLIFQVWVSFPRSSVLNR